MRFYESLTKEAQTMLLQIIASWQRQGWKNNTGFHINQDDPAETAAMDELIDRHILRREDGRPIRCTLTEEGRNFLRQMREELLVLGTKAASL